MEKKIKNEISPNKGEKKIKKNISVPFNVYYEGKNNVSKAWTKKDNLNIEARGMYSCYHIKTHFKATEEIHEYKSNIKNKSKDSFYYLIYYLKIIDIKF